MSVMLKTCPTSPKGKIAAPRPAVRLGCAALVGGLFDLMNLRQTFTLHLPLSITCVRQLEPPPPPPPPPQNNQEDDENGEVRKACPSLIGDLRWLATYTGKGESVVVGVCREARISPLTARLVVALRYHYHAH